MQEIEVSDELNYSVVILGTEITFDVDVLLFSFMLLQWFVVWLVFLHRKHINVSSDIKILCSILSKSIKVVPGYLCVSMKTNLLKLIICPSLLIFKPAFIKERGDMSLTSNSDSLFSLIL